MDFFEHQDQARRSSSRLVVLFVLAVLGILLAINLVAYLIVAWIHAQAPTEVYYPSRAPRGIVVEGSPRSAGVAEVIRRHGDVFIYCTAGALAVIGLGSVYKTASLSAGGSAVARSMGGRPIRPDTIDPEERMLLNVVQEMSIASGVPVPAVYVLEQESGINAFAAGWSTQDACIGVTRGCLQALTRDELQGVIAHEFSHVLNGDMRLNLRLIGLLHGIMVIALIGYAAMRVMVYSRPSARRDKNGGGIVVVALAGLALLIIGYVGVFFGRLIQAAVSRQREFLADASAVQFTRNPSGIAGALKKIAGWENGSAVNHPNAVESAHLMFSGAMSGLFAGWFATHPPLEERIRRIDAAFDPGQARAVAHRPLSTSKSAAAIGLAGVAGIEPAAMSRRVGLLTPQQVAHAAQWIDSLPQSLRQAAEEPFAARALVFGLLLSNQAPVREAQIQALKAADAAAAGELARLAPRIDALGIESRLPILELALPALRLLSPGQANSFRKMVSALIQADRKVSLFEYALARIVRRQLADEAPARAAKPASARSVDDSLRVVLGALSTLAGGDEQSVQRAFEAGLEQAGLQTGGRPDVSLAALDQALNCLSRANGNEKRRVVDAAARVVSADGVVRSPEAELLRAISVTLDCPMPPLVDAGL